MKIKFLEKSWWVDRWLPCEIWHKVWLRERRLMAEGWTRDVFNIFTPADASFPFTVMTLLKVHTIELEMNATRPGCHVDMKSQCFLTCKHVIINSNTLPSKTESINLITWIKNRQAADFVWVVICVIIDGTIDHQWQSIRQIKSHTHCNN